MSSGLSSAHMKVMLCFLNTHFLSLHVKHSQKLSVFSPLYFTTLLAVLEHKFDEGCSYKIRNRETIKSEELCSRCFRQPAIDPSINQLLV
jgi:hypothetical protein